MLAIQLIFFTSTHCKTTNDMQYYQFLGEAQRNAIKVSTLEIHCCFIQTLLHQSPGGVFWITIAAYASDFTIKGLSALPLWPLLSGVSFNHKYCLLNRVWSPKNLSRQELLYWCSYFRESMWCHTDTVNWYNFLRLMNCTRTKVVK